ncbi:MAG TPA: hypothetical protein VHR72_05495 [Gemmataceae bacterium]|nr:hypothetical protein [Gemmataceae bacterium]
MRWSTMTRADTLLLRSALRKGGKLPDAAALTIIRALRRMIANDAHKGDHCRVEREGLGMLGVGLSDANYFQPGPADEPQSAA